MKCLKVNWRNSANNLGRTFEETFDEIFPANKGEFRMK